jgi:hypothetical protein
MEPISTAAVATAATGVISAVKAEITAPVVAALAGGIIVGVGICWLTSRYRVVRQDQLTVMTVDPAVKSAILAAVASAAAPAPTPATPATP